MFLYKVDFLRCLGDLAKRILAMLPSLSLLFVQHALR